ncbi:chromatin assembly factor-I (CAF-I) p90 subunit [Kalmusia sp. IMI 367209]|nr:chromatin assembly factor-I (CAF-I) p90 subunit [Kalmusia sp. IMI 367209]
MEAPIPMVLASPQKRAHTDDDVGPCVYTPNRTAPSTSSTPLTNLSSIDTPSPLRDMETEANAPTRSTDTDTVIDDAAPAPVSSSTPQPAKRRKLTPQEKEEQLKEKEAKAKARADKKAQKEEEDRLKADQKAQREEARAEKKRAKELKQQQEEDEKKKKERSQMKLNAFFVKPKVAMEPAGNTTVDPVQKPSIGQTYLSADIVETDTNSAPPSPQKAIVKNAQSDYDRFFLPFCLPAHAILAPCNPLLRTPEDLIAARRRLDGILAERNVEMESVTMDSLRSLFPKRRRGLETNTIMEIVDRVNGSVDNPIDLTQNSSVEPLELLTQIPMKYLHFGEDVRPPYYGTYTKLHTPHQERKVARNPLTRGLPDMNYDYDSEAEWDEPEEGEDLDSEGEEDLDEEGDEDMDGFLDDEDDPEVKRRLLNGDQEPVSTGLCWEDANGVSRLNDGSGAISTEFKEFRMGFLLEPQPLSIDPFSTTYWAPEPSATRNIQAMVKGDQAGGSMNPPRLPLTSRPVNPLMNTLNATQKTSAGSAAKPVKAKRMISPDLLPAFKAEVQGQDLTKIGMIEALKKKFPKVPKDAITNTLTDIAKRVGPSEKEKRWVLFA